MVRAEAGVAEVDVVGEVDVRHRPQVLLQVDIAEALTDLLDDELAVGQPYHAALLQRQVLARPQRPPQRPPRPYLPAEDDLG